LRAPGGKLAPAEVFGGNREPELREAIQETGEGNLRFQPGEGSAGAEVGAVAGAEVLVVGAEDLEGRGIAEPVLGAVRVGRGGS
jgi:hypothetical protein